MSQMNREPVFFTIPSPPDYMEFVDADIRALFDGRGSYFSNEPLTAQLIKELRLLREALKPQERA